MPLQQEENHEYEDVEKYKNMPATTTHYTTPPAAGPPVLTQQSRTVPVPVDDIDFTACPAYVSTMTRGREELGRVEEEEQQYEEVATS